jgi:hypothetical protein
MVSTVLPNAASTFARDAVALAANGTARMVANSRAKAFVMAN